MKTFYRFSILFAFAALFVLLLSFWATLAAPVGTLSALKPQHTSGAAAGELVGGFVALGNTVNITGQNGSMPALVVNPLSGDIWAAIVQDDLVIATKFMTATGEWQTQGGALGVAGGNSPALALSGDDGSSLWLAWSEPVAQQIQAAWFDGAQWNGTVVPNHDPSRTAVEPALTSGHSEADLTAVPWAAWSEVNVDGDGRVVVSRAVSDTTATGDYRWEAVGETLNLDPNHDGNHPDVAFAGQMAWAVWQETGTGDVNRIYARRAISDTSEATGFRWDLVSRVLGCGASETACALNFDSGKNATAPHIASGLLTNENIAGPWIVFVERGADGHDDIRVMRLDVADTPNDFSDDRFLPVGKSVNQQCLGDSGQSGEGGSQPDIYFVGNVPHVAWIETVGDHQELNVCHLADIRFGQERWDLDSYYPLNRSAVADAAAPALASDGVTPYVAWQESDGQIQVYVARRSPPTPAWGRNYPPFIRTISWSRDRLAAQVAPQRVYGSTRAFTLTTSCNHTGGWQHIVEIQYKIANDEFTAFLGRYVAAEDKLYIENPDQPGTFFDGVKPKTGSPIATDYVTFFPEQTAVRTHGDDSPVLDIDWVISFTDLMKNQDFKQYINIVYDNGQTGFFETGALSFDLRMFLPRSDK